MLFFRFAIEIDENLHAKKLSVSTNLYGFLFSQTERRLGLENLNDQNE
jgi:hypothetical protein